MSKIVKGLYYTNDHEWLKVEGNTAYIGITDYAQHALGDIVFVELPEVDDEFSPKDSFAVIESVKSAADSYMPVSAKILEVNEALEDAPEKINEDAYDSWIVKVELLNESELKELMDSEKYEELLKSLED